MDCKICNGEEALMVREKRSKKKDYGYIGFDISVEDGTLLVAAVPDTYEPAYMDTEIKINYCPICGKRLSREKQTLL